MNNNLEILKLMQKYKNLLIPQIPPILAQYLSNHEEYILLIVDKKWSTAAILAYLYKCFDKTQLDELDVEITENFILHLLLEYFDLPEVKTKFD